MSNSHLLISYAASEGEVAQTIQQQLASRGFNVGLVDSAPISPRTAAGALARSQAVAVLLNSDRLSEAQKVVIGAALARQERVEQAGQTFPVVPVLLSTAAFRPAFLFRDHWLDLRDDLAAARAIDKLERVTRGEAARRPIAVPVDCCPYPGLRPFREEEAGFFFGREDLIARLQTAVEQSQLVILTGPSASGKTSLVQAGLLPQLRRQKQWTVISLNAPPLFFAELASPAGAARRVWTQGIEPLLAPPEDSRILLVLDQLEILTTALPAGEQSRFLDLLVAAVARQPALTLLLVIGIEQYGSFLAGANSLASPLPPAPFFVPPPGPAELRRLITRPARLVNLGLEPSLVDFLVENGQDLAELQAGLRVLWTQHRGGLLDWSLYDQVGGLAGALDTRAEAIWQTLPIELKQQARPIFEALVDLAPAGQARLRLRRRDDLEQVTPPEQVQKIVQLFSEEGWLVAEKDHRTGVELISLTRTDLLDRWLRLRTWLDDKWAFLLWQRRLPGSEVSFGVKTNLGRKRAFPFKAYRQRKIWLAEAERWLRERPADLSPVERAYLQKGLARRRHRQMARWVIGVALIVAALFIINSLLGQQQRRLNQVIAERNAAQTAQAQAEGARQAAAAGRATAEAGQAAAEQGEQRALARQLAVQSLALLAEDKTQAIPSLLLATESLRRAALPEGEQALRQGLRQLLRPAGRLAHSSEVNVAVYSPDGRRLLTRNGYTARIWEVASGQEIARLDHANFVSDANFSPDSRWVVTASLEPIVRVWDALTGREVGRLTHKDTIWKVEFSEDGAWLIARGARVVYGWELSTSNAVGMIMLSAMRPITVTPELSLALKRLDRGEPPIETVSAVVGRGAVRVEQSSLIAKTALSADRRWLVTGGVDGWARVWEMATGRQVGQLSHTDTIRDVAFSPAGTLLAIGSADQTVNLWPVPGDDQASWPAQAHVSLPHAGAVTLVRFSPDGRWLATGDDKHQVLVWFIDPGPKPGTITVRQVAHITHLARIQDIVFSPDSRWLVTAGADGTAQVWLTTTGRLLAQMTHTGRINSVAFSPDGRQLATTGADRAARLWETTIGYEVTQMAHEDWVLDVAFSPNPMDDGDKYLLATRSRQTARLWRSTTGQELFRLDQPRYVNAVAFSGDGRYLATASYRLAQVWHMMTGQEVIRLSPKGLVKAIAFSPGEARWLATAGIEKVVRLWDITTGQEAAQLLHEDWVNDLSFSPDGYWLATGSSDNTARLWEVATGTEVARLAHGGVVNDVAFSRDGRWLATASGDKTARIWVATTTRELARLAHPAGVAQVAFSPAGQWLATRSGNQIWVWETTTGELVARLNHDRTTAGMAFSPDGRTLATIGGNREAYIWDIATGRPVSRLSHEYWVNGVAFSPDGRWLATASVDHLARVWWVRREDLLDEACRRLPRNLTQAEWTHYFGDEPYRLTCPDLESPIVAGP